LFYLQIIIMFINFIFDYKIRLDPLFGCRWDAKPSFEYWNAKSYDIYSIW